MIFRQFFDRETSTYTYLLADRETREAVLIDPVLGQEERDLAQLSDLGLRLLYTLETHVHADHITSSGRLRRRTHSRIVVSRKSGVEGADLYVKGGDSIRFGKYALEVRETPGHTDGCITFVTSDERMAFTGDALLIRGCGRTDFQQGDSRLLYRSIRDEIFSLPDSTCIYPGHDYKGRMVTSVGEEKRLNPRLRIGISEDRFVEIMAGLDLSLPARIDEAVPANLRCGLPSSEVEEGMPAPTEERPWAPITRTVTGVPEVDVEWLSQRIDDVILVDVREPDEFTGPMGHIEGAKLVPLDTVEHAARQWDRDAPLVTVCRSGGRSGRAALILEAMGFRRVASMAGGMLDWHARNKPFVS